MPYLGIFELEFEKNMVVFKISILEFLLKQSLVQKNKSLNLGPKMPDLGILGLEFEKNIVIFKISVLEFVLKQSLAQK